MHPLFPYVIGAIAAGALVGLIAAIESAISFRDEVRAWQASAQARLVFALEKLQDRLGAVEQEAQRRDLALERQADELMQHRLSLPPPALFAPARPRVETSADWADDARSTQIRQSTPPALPAFNRPEYMARD